MLLNETNSLIHILRLLDSPEVYKYEDIITTSGEEPDIITTTTTAESQMEDDIKIISEEVYLNNILPVVSSAYYQSVQAVDFANYTVNQKRLFFAEVYFIASKFLMSWAFKNETEMYKETLDLSGSKTRAVEKSGKIYTAEQYIQTAKNYMAEFEREFYSVDLDSYYGRNKRSNISIGRY